MSELSVEKIKGLLKRGVTTLDLRGIATHKNSKTKYWLTLHKY